MKKYSIKTLYHIDCGEQEKMSNNTKLLKEYIKFLLKEDAIGFAHDLSKASKHFSGNSHWGRGKKNPTKLGGKAIKRAFSKNADYKFLNSLGTVHWADEESLRILLIRDNSKNELSTSMSLPNQSLDKHALPNRDYGLWVKGRVTLAANDHDYLYTGSGENIYYDDGDYDVYYNATKDQIRKYTNKKRSSGINKLPLTADDYKHLSKIDKSNIELLPKMTPYVIDRNTWNPAKYNEALVDNWKAIGIVIPRDAQEYFNSILGMSYEDIQGNKDFMPGLRRIVEYSKKYNLNIYDVDRNILWSPAK
jgi:hypothetical protein